MQVEGGIRCSATRIAPSTALPLSQVPLVPQRAVACHAGKDKLPKKATTPSGNLWDKLQSQIGTRPASQPR